MLLIRRMSFIFATTLSLLVFSAGMLLAQGPMPTAVTEQERHVGLWLTEWQRIPISDTVQDVIGWSEDGESLLIFGEHQLYWWNIAEQITDVVATNVLWSFGDKLPIAWDSEHGQLTYPRQTGQDSADLVVVDGNGNWIRTLGSFRDPRYPHPTPSAANDSETIALSLNDNGRFSILYEDHIVTVRADEAEQNIPLPVELQRRLDDVKTPTHDYWSLENYHSFWMSPNAQYFAVAITQSLTIYEVGIETPIFLHDAPHAGEWGPSRANQLTWSPNSHAFYVQFATVSRVLARPTLSAAQSLRSSILQPLGHSTGMPRIEGLRGSPSQVSWSPNGVWLIAGRSGSQQCGSVPPFGCVNAQTLVDLWGLQTPITLWSAETTANQHLWLTATGAWASDNRRYATACQLSSAIEETPRKGAICILNFGWKPPKVDPCATPLTPQLYCGEPNDMTTSDVAIPSQ